MAASQRTMTLPLQAPGLVAGVDEAGRGPLAGPVVAAAVILDPRRRIRGIKDSKQLEAEERESLAIKIRGAALAWSVAWADVEEIDCHNILQATHLAMRRALLGLHIHPGHVQVDGNLCPSFIGLPMKCSYEAIIDGDALRTCIGAASILAKVTRDRMMCELDTIYPNYGFASHKGYSTPQHYEALDQLGPTPIHRRSFEPVRIACSRLSPTHALYMPPLEPKPEAANGAPKTSAGRKRKTSLVNESETLASESDTVAMVGL